MEYKELTEKIIGCAYLVNYLVATEKPVGLIINFGERKVEIKRSVKILKIDRQGK